MKADNLLTKTDYLYYLEAPMHLWAKTHGWLEVTAPSDFEQHLMAQGVTVQGLAQEHLRRKIGEQHPGAEIHFETMLTDEDYFARLDAAVYFPDEDVWDIYEIKSGSSIRKEHLLDAAFQHLVAAANLNLRDTFIVHINKQYCRLGELDLDDLFVLENVNQDIRELYEELKITRELALHTTQAQAPDRIETCLKPNDCPCPRLCHPNLPKHPIYDLPRIGKKAVTLRNAGITAITDIPAEFPLSANQARHVEAVRTNQPGIDLDGIRATLGGLVYPLYFLDYETFNPAIPWYNRYAPYQHIVFQYSLHACNSPGVEAAHFEHLAIKNTDPVPALAAELLDTIGPVGKVVVWNKSGC